ncbi:MAG: class I SAM-dependent methyltransferase [Gammaproteobacteria bacterium]
MQQPDTEHYALGYENEIVSKLNLRSVAREGAFILPYVKPEARMLDAGCGPGSLTLGFAPHIAPGRISGIDIDTDQITLAREAAVNQGMDNVDFHHASVYELPFEDDTFDIVFGHTLFMHLSQPEAALKEIHRVCKKGAIVGIRDGLGSIDRLLTGPINPQISDLYQLLKKITALSGGDPDVGIKLKGLLHHCGFNDIRIKPFSEVYDTAADMEMLKQWHQSLLQGSLGQLAVKHNLLSNSEREQLIEQMNEWPNNPEAISVITWIEHIARK